jgi:hypothetical protein
MGHGDLIGNIYNSETILRSKGEMAINKLTFNATIQDDPENFLIPNALNLKLIKSVKSLMFIVYTEKMWANL